MRSKGGSHSQCVMKENTSRQGYRGELLYASVIAGSSSSSSSSVHIPVQGSASQCCCQTTKIQNKAIHNVNIMRMRNITLHATLGTMQHNSALHSPALLVPLPKLAGPPAFVRTYPNSLVVMVPSPSVYNSVALQRKLCASTNVSRAPPMQHTKIENSQPDIEANAE